VKKIINHTEIEHYIETELPFAAEKPLKFLPGMNLAFWKITTRNTFVKIEFTEEMLKKKWEISKIMYKYRKSLSPQIVIINFRAPKRIGVKPKEVIGHFADAAIQTENFGGFQTPKSCELGSENLEIDSNSDLLLEGSNIRKDSKYWKI